ncbi:MAG: Ig-like domain-containing protein [Prevotellaceae bacterium]|nr:Ig-like domain-containing protein [Prevotellaceae bacterium]
MKKLILFCCSLFMSISLFAFDVYKDSTFLSNDDIVACPGKNQTYQTWMLTDSRDFEYSGSFIKDTYSAETTEQYIQLKKYSSDPYSWVELPDVGFPIEEIVLTVGDNTGPIDSPVAFERYVYFIKDNFPGQFKDGIALDVAAENVIVRQEVTGLTSVTLKITSPTATRGYLIAGDKGGFRIWDIKLKWTVDRELPANGLEVTPKELTMAVDAKDSLSVKLSPRNAVENITWGTTNNAVASVSDKGVVTALSAGEVGIVAYSSDSTYTDTCFVQVRPKAQAISISIASQAVDTIELVADVTGNIFDIQNLEIQFSPEGAFVEEVNWQSSDVAVATVDASGEVVSVAPGTAMIFATTKSGLKDSCVVNVIGKLMPTQVIINTHELTFEKDQYTTLTATVLPDELEESLKEVSWYSSNDRIATVSARGYVVARSAGVAYIVANAYNGVADSCKIIVSGQPTEGEYYVKVTKEPTSWEGKYLIVCEELNLAMDGALAEFDVAQNTQPVSIADEAIEATSTTNAFSFTVNTFQTGYSIQGKSGKYIGYNAAETQYGNDNGLQSSETALLNQIVLDNLNTKINGADGSQLMYNTDAEAAGRTLLFRYYKNPVNTILAPVQLYRYIGTNTAVKSVELTNVYYDINNGIIHNIDGQELGVYSVCGVLLMKGNSDLNISRFQDGVYIIKSTNGLLKIVK